MVKERVTILKYSLLWMLTGIILLLFAVFPKILSYIAHVFGVYSDSNFLYLILIAFLLMISFSLTHIVSKQSENIKKLTQQLAIAEKNITDLKNSLSYSDTEI